MLWVWVITGQARLKLHPEGFILTPRCSSMPIREPGTTPAHTRGDGMSQVSSRCSVLQPGLSVTGRLVSTGDIVIGGRIDGEVSGVTVEVLQGASIRGGLKADHAIIHGLVDGRVHARTVTIGAGGTVKGEIRYGSLEIARGARIETRMLPTQGEWKPFPDVPGPPPGLENRSELNERGSNSEQTTQRTRNPFSRRPASRKQGRHLRP